MTTIAAVSPRAVFSVLQASYRNLDVADAAVAGRFNLCGRTLNLGAVPDWRTDPHPDDKEWRVEWVKFYYGLDLAHAYAVTRDSRYAAAWTRLVGSYIEQVPAGTDATEVAARRIQNWIYAGNRFALEAGPAGSLDVLSPDAVRHLWHEVEQVRDHLTKERNHRTLELYALFVAALAFPHLDRHGLREFAFEQLHANLLADVRPDGVHRECSTHYHCIVLRSFLGAIQNARLAGMPVPASYVERVTLASEFALHCHRPDGRIPACSDADSESYADVLRLAGRLLDRPDFVWAASAGREGAVPARRHADFPAGGYFIQRSGWGTDRPYQDERFLIFDCGPLGDGGHGHYDQLSVEVAALGRPLLVDPGRFTYAETGPNWRHWFKGTAAHNTVLVDGLDQTPYARRKPKGLVAAGRLLARATAPDLDLIVGTCSSPSYDALHTRAVMFVAGEYWLVADYLAAQQPHVYQLRWHLSAEAGSGAVICPDAPGLVVGRGFSLSCDGVGALHIEDGWVAPSYGVKHAAPVVVMTVPAISTTFLTAIVPRASGSGRVPRLRVLHRPARHTDPFVAEVQGIGPDGASVDTFMWASACVPMTVGQFQGTARAAWSRVDGHGRAVAFSAVDVLDGSWRGADRMGDGAPGLCASWMDAESSVRVTRDSA